MLCLDAEKRSTSKIADRLASCGDDLAGLHHRLPILELSCYRGRSTWSKDDLSVAPCSRGAILDHMPGHRVSSLLYTLRYRMLRAPKVIDPGSSQTEVSEQDIMEM